MAKRRLGATNDSDLQVRSTPLVSVITPTYHHREWIGDCIGSVRAQGYSSWEQIVIDDGSTDGTVEAAVAAQGADSRISLECQDHQGIARLAATYNRALARCRGTLIATLEGDDVWMPEMLATLVPLFERPDVVLAYGVTTIIGDPDRRSQQIPSARFKQRFGDAALRNNPVGQATRAMLHRGGLTFTYPCSVIVRRSALEAIGGFQHFEDFGAVDYPTYLQLSLQGQFGFVDTTVACWRAHSGSASWRRHDLMLRRARQYVRSFVEAHRAELGADAVSEIVHSWRDHEQRLALDAGRRALVERRWREARPAFARAIHASAPVALAAVIGYGASWLRTDIEGLIRATGRDVDLRALRDPAPATSSVTR